MYIGVDVGTGSARACLMDEKGEIVALASKDITKWEPKAEHINQSSNEIWQSICYCTKKILEDSKISAEKVKGIAFDATCSLVVVDRNFDPIAVGPEWDNSDQNIILWMDHRAPDETDLIAATKAPLLKYVGGKMSIEMEIPKILWLKNHMDKESWSKAHFYDLPDFLTGKATNVDARSYNSTVCKQGYVPPGVDGSEDGWNTKFFEEIGLKDLEKDEFVRMGGIAKKNGIFHSAGEPVGNLAPKAAEELGLTINTVVGSGVIDAYSGWIGTVAAKTAEDLPHQPVTTRLAAVAGTSTCHIVVSEEAVFVPGVWGPYRDVLIPGMWAAEGGQTATGELLAYVLKTHPARPILDAQCKESGKSVFDVLNEQLANMAKGTNSPSVYHLAKHFFFYGDLYGNRSPIADPRMRGSIIGVGRDVTIEDLAITYLGAVEFICQQTRQIIEAMDKSGHNVKSIYLSGGQSRNNLLTQLLATCTGLPVVIPKYIDAAVVFGTAILAAKATDPKWSLWDAMSCFSGNGTTVHPEKDAAVLKLLSAKYEVFLDQAERQRIYRKQIDDAIHA